MRKLKISCEIALSRYYAAFDIHSTRKISPRWNISLTPFAVINLGPSEDGKTTTCDDAMMYAGYLSKEAKITLIHFQKIGLDCVDFKFHGGN